jgi:hypothetical protein
MSVVKENGIVKYLDKDGLLHRTDGPAVIYPDGSLSWWIHGLRHRLDGPAVSSICDIDSISFEWWIDGEFLFVSSQEQFEKTPEYKRFKLIAFT